MKVGYAVLYEDGTLTISKEHTILQKPIYKDYGEFEDMNIPWINDTYEIKIVKILNQVKSNSMNSWFDNCKNLTILIDFQNLDVSNCEDFSYTFFSCKNLKNISSLKNWNVSNGKDFSRMFYGCKSLQDLKGLQNWNVSNGIIFSRIFFGCFNLKEIHLSDTLQFLNRKMFEGCSPMLQIHWKGKIYTYEDLMEYQEF